MKKFAGLAVSTAVLVLPNLASAQLAGASAGAQLSTSGEAKGEMMVTEPLRAEAVTEASAEGPGRVPPSPIPAEKPLPPEARPKKPDHDLVVRRFGVGYMGMRDIPIGTNPGNPGLAAVSAPLVGVRYWVGTVVGVDAGLGFFLRSGTITIPGSEDTYTPSFTGVLVHGGLPLAIANSRHLSFQVTPEFNVGLANSVIDIDDPDSTFHGSHWDVGVRLGAEVHFGFIDIPKLSLQGSVGVRYVEDSTGGEVDNQDFSTSTTTIETTVGNNPWDIFTGSVSALYYF